MAEIEMNVEERVVQIENGNHTLRFRLLEDGTIVAVTEYYQDVTNGVSMVKASFVDSTVNQEDICRLASVMSAGNPERRIEIFSMTTDRAGEDVQLTRILNIFDKDDSLVYGQTRVNGVFFNTKKDSAIYPFQSYHSEHSSFLYQNYHSFFDANNRPLPQNRLLSK